MPLKSAENPPLARRITQYLEAIEYGEVSLYELLKGPCKDYRDIMRSQGQDRRFKAFVRAVLKEQGYRKKQNSLHGSEYHCVWTRCPATQRRYGGFSLTEGISSELFYEPLVAWLAARPVTVGRGGERYRQASMDAMIHTAMGIPTNGSRLSHTPVAREVARVLRMHGWERIMARINGKTARVWRKYVD